MPAAEGIVSATRFKERLLQVDINRQQLDETVMVLEDESGQIYLSSRALQSWRFHSPAAGAAIEYQGRQFFPLSALSDISHTYDPKALTLTLEVRPEAFTGTTLTEESMKISPPVKSGPGGFFNYDLFAANSPDASQRSGLFEFGYFNRYGVGTGNVLVDHVNGTTHSTRLDTTWTIDRPEKLQTLRLGDAINVPGTWGRSVRFGGVQFGTNFGTQPGFSTFPTQSVAGQAALPSTVDIFVNNALVSSQNVPPGPFSIRNLPIVTGAGEVQLVVRDLLGREQLVTRPFYYSQALLREGLEAYSYELGMVRENFGIASNEYGSAMASGTYRRGVSERFTGEIHAEAMSDTATMGAGGDYLVPHIGTLSTYVAGSRSSGGAGNGAFALLGLERQARKWSFGGRTQWATRSFRQIGQAPLTLPPVQSSSLNLSYAAGRAGSIGVAYVVQNNRDQSDLRLATLSYSVSLGKLGSFSVSAMRNLSGVASTSVFAMLNIPLGASTSASVTSQSVRSAGGGSNTDFTTTLQRNLPMGEGYGYRVMARSDGAREATYSLQNNVGTYTLAAAQAQGSTETRLNASGGVALLGGDMFPSRRIDQSFAVARIPDYPNVRMLTDNQPAGRTDAGGNALIPRLRAYDRNVISIDQRDLPLDAEIHGLKVEAVPYFRSGIDVRFPIKRSRGATFTVRIEDGSPLPVGALVQEAGNDAVYTAGYDGEVYAAGLGPATRLRATWEDHSCFFDVQFEASSDPLPDLGTFICKGVTP